MKTKRKTIIFSGGGTGGSVAPLLAISSELKKKYPNWRIIFFGRFSGVEKQMVKREGLKYCPIFSGKLRRYISIKNFLDIFNILAALIQSFIYLLIFRPKAVLSAGSFVSVPVAYSAYLLKIPVFSHQQDIKVGLANKLMAIVSKKVSVTFLKSLDDFKDKAILTGNPVREEFKNINASREDLLKKYNLKTDLPVLLALGGGTGAQGINDLIFKTYNNLKGKVQIIHILGNRKAGDIEDSNYHSYNFLEAQKIAEILYLSDLVISRCGLGLITELSYLAKPTIFIPMPNSHQEDNADYIKKHQAGIVLKQGSISSEEFSVNVLGILSDDEARKKYQDNLSKLVPKQASEKIINMIEDYVR
ncbi:MAG: UDP-N-acetylglucosamine--N-acetylmuramyl-(pentapeptide) pyrophosphoryl-undecaprenol N-acetylglucosamine transferase [Parcubacteria group bacterium]